MTSLGRGALLVVTLALAVLAAGAWLVGSHAETLGAVRWLEPRALWLLPLAPLVLWRGTLGADARGVRLRVGALGPLAAGPRGARAWLRDVPGVLRAAAIGAFVLALARPVDTLRPETNSELGIDMVLVLDLSGSMEAVLENLPPDLLQYVPPKAQGELPTRLDGAKAVLRDFIGRRKSDRIGVVVFARDAYVLSPPTLDTQLLDTLVSRMELGLIDGGATAIGDAVGVAVARLRRSDAKSKAILLLTDGDNNAGELGPEYAAHLANVVGAKLFTIQIGEGDVGVAQDGHDLFGRPRYVKKHLPTNPALLARLAEKTGAASYVASDVVALRASLNDVLDRLERTRFESTAATYVELYRMLLLPGALLLALDVLLRALLLRRFP